MTSPFYVKYPLVIKHGNGKIHYLSDDFPFEPPITLHFPIVCYIFPWFSHGFPTKTSGRTVGPGTGLLDNT